MARSSEREGVATGLRTTTASKQKDAQASLQCLHGGSCFWVDSWGAGFPDSSTSAFQLSCRFWNSDFMLRGVLSWTFLTALTGHAKGFLHISHIQSYIHTQAFPNIHTYKLDIYLYTSVHVCICVCIYIYIYIHIVCTCIYIYIRFPPPVIFFLRGKLRTFGFGAAKGQSAILENVWGLGRRLQASSTLCVSGFRVEGLELGLAKPSIEVQY